MPCLRSLIKTIEQLRTEDNFVEIEALYRGILRSDANQSIQWLDVISLN